MQFPVVIEVDPREALENQKRVLTDLRCASTLAALWFHGSRGLTDDAMRVIALPVACACCYTAKRLWKSDRSSVGISQGDRQPTRWTATTHSSTSMYVCMDVCMSGRACRADLSSLGGEFHRAGITFRSTPIAAALTGDVLGLLPDTASSIEVELANQDRRRPRGGDRTPC